MANYSISILETVINYITTPKSSSHTLDDSSPYTGRAFRLDANFIFKQSDKLKFIKHFFQMSNFDKINRLKKFFIYAIIRIAKCLSFTIKFVKMGKNLVKRCFS